MASQASRNESYRKQTLVFMRHGIALHNVVDRVTGTAPNLKDPRLFDPPLTLQGKREALDAGIRLRQWWDTMGISLDLVISSPLTRCLQTASLVMLPGDEYTRGSPEPTFVCVEAVREAYGKNYPDKRRNKSELEPRWPMFHFDYNMSETDEGWKSDQREKIADVVNRTNQFLDRVVICAESNITVVSHGVWIESCFRKHCPDALAHGDRVYNCDMFAADCLSRNGKFKGLENVRRI